MCCSAGLRDQVGMAVYLSFDHKAWSVAPRPKGLEASLSPLLKALRSPLTFFWPMGEGLSLVDKDPLAGLLRVSVLNLNSTRDCGSFSD